jgi:hypothetical protein
MGETNDTELNHHPLSDAIQKLASISKEISDAHPKHADELLCDALSNNNILKTLNTKTLTEWITDTSDFIKEIKDKSLQQQIIFAKERKTAPFYLLLHKIAVASIPSIFVLIWAFGFVISGLKDGSIYEKTIETPSDGSLLSTFYFLTMIFWFIGGWAGGRRKNIKPHVKKTTGKDIFTNSFITIALTTFGFLQPVYEEWLHPATLSGVLLGFESGVSLAVAVALVFDMLWPLLLILGVQFYFIFRRYK